MAKSRHQRDLAQLDLFAKAQRNPRERATAEHVAELVRSMREEGRDENWAYPTTLQPGDTGILFGQPCTVLKVGYAYALVRQAGSEDHWVGGWWITERKPRR
jgi:hypothetical protein